MSSASSSSSPPSPPAVERAVRVYPHQVVSLAFFGAITVLAMAGAFGRSGASVEAGQGMLAVRVEHTARFRYGQQGSLDAWVTNTSLQQLDSVRVSFDTALIRGFSSVRFTPSADRPFVVTLSPVGPGTTRLVHAEFQADRAGLRHGTVSVSAPGTDTVRIRFRTLVFP